MANIGSLVAYLELNSAGFVQSMGNATRTAEEAMKRIDGAASIAKNALAGLVGAASIGGLATLVKNAVQATAALDDFSEITGASVESLSALRQVARVAETDFQLVVTSMTKLAKNLAGVDEESKGAGLALAAIGLRLNDIKALRADEQIQTIAKAMDRFEDSGSKAAASQALFGKAGAELLPYLKDLAQWGALHASVTTEQSAEAERLSKSIFLLKSDFQDISVQLSANLVPYFQLLADEMKGAGREAGDMTAGFSLLEVVFQTVIVMGSEVGFVFKAIGTEIGGVAAQLGALASGDFSGFSSIGEAMRKDAEIARIEHDKFISKVMNMGKVVADQNAHLSSGAAGVEAGAKGVINYSSAVEKLGHAAKKSRKELDALLNRLEGNESGFNAKFYHELAILNKEFGSKNPERYQRLMTELVKSTDYGKKIFKDAAEAAKAHNDAVDAAYDVLEKERMAVENGIKGFRDKAEAIEFETTLIGLSSAAREKALILHELEAKKVGLSAEAYAELSDKVKGLLDRINSAAGQRNALADAMEQQVSFWKSLENVAHQTWTSIADGGKNIWQRIKDTAKNVFFDWLYQLTLKKWMINLVTSASGVGVAEQVFGASAVRSAGSNALGTAGNVASISNALGLGTVSGAGIGSIVSGSAYGTGFLSQQSLMLAAQETTGLASSVLSGLSSVASALPWIAGALAIGSLLSSKGETRAGGVDYKYGHAISDSAGNYSNYGINGITAVGGSSGGAISGIADLTGTSVAGINTLLKSLGSNAYLTGFQSGAETSGKGRGGVYSGGTLSTGAVFGDMAIGSNYSGGKYESTSSKNGNAEQITANYVAEMAQVTIQVLQAATDIPRSAMKFLSTIDSESLSLDQANGVIATVRALSALEAPLMALGVPLENITAGALEAAGGIDTLNAIFTALPETLDQIPDVFEAVRLSSLSVSSSYRALTDNAFDLAGSFDGSLASAQQLGSVMQARYQSEMQLLQQVDAMIKGIHTSTVSAAEGYLLDTLDAQGKYNFYDRGMDSALAMIKLATDPEVINTYAQQYIGYMNSAWGTLSQDQKVAGLGGFQSAAATLDATVTAAGANISATLSAENSNLAASIKTAIAESIRDSFAPVTAGMVNAVNTPLKVESSVDISITTSPGFEASVL